MFDVTNYSDSANKKTNTLNSFLSTVAKVYLKQSDFLKYEKSDSGDVADTIKVYNNNSEFIENDTTFYGAIDFKTDNTLSESNLYHAFPFDKNNLTLPIEGETVLIIEVNNDYFWLPFSKTPYPNYREDFKTSEKLSPSDVTKTNTKDKNTDYNKKKQTGVSTTANTNSKTKELNYKINEKIKFLQPKEGDTIISGRFGNTIRFSELFLTEDDKSSSPGIFIRNKQNPELDSKKIGELIEEDINKDGTSIYLTSGKVKVPFKETIKKEKKGFKDYPSSDKLKGDQLFVNSDRIVLSAKASEFIIFGKGNTGVITDGQYSVDAEKDIYLHTNKNVTIHSAGANQIFLNSENGNIYLGKNTGVGAAGSSVQKMVLGGELVQILGEILDEITKQVYATPCGPSSTGPVNVAAFKAIKGKLNTLLSAKNYLSKS